MKKVSLSESDAEASGLPFLKKDDFAAEINSERIE